MSEQTWINPEVDRSDWGPGPWDGEPDKAAWTDPETGLPCIAARGNPRWGGWCGYVAVEPDHPLHGRDYEAPDVEVHGGLTFASGCHDDGPVESAICHVPEPGKSGDVWWFGWDCGHAWDIMPGQQADMRRTGIGLPAPGPDISYKDLDFVKAECASLAKQLKALDV